MKTLLERRAQSTAWRKANPERMRAYRKKWLENNRERRRQWFRAWSAENRERLLLQWRASYARNCQSKRAASKRWWANNMARGLSLNARRRARLVQQTPSWSDLDAIAAIYLERERVQRETGIEQHVDHVIPLKGRTVCGLHVHTNLRVIPAAMNRSKHNRFEVITC